MPTATSASAATSEGVTRLGVRRGTWLRGYAYSFIETFAPTLTREAVERAVRDVPSPE